MRTNRRNFIKRIGLGSLGLALIDTLTYGNYSQIGGRHGLPRSTPEAQGISSSAISHFLQEIAKSKIDFHSIMVLRYGHVIAEGW